MTEFWIGTSGWHYAWWKGAFYPPELPATAWLAHFAGLLSTVEINNSFYKNPSATTWEAWRDTAPECFRFAVKGSRWVTWNKLLLDVEGSLVRFLDGAKILGPKLGPVLYQLPPWFRRKPEHAERLEAFLAIIPADTQAVFEFLHASWWVDETYEQLNRHGAGFSFSDRHDKQFPLEVTGPLAYLRLHGPGAGIASNYSQVQIEQWAVRFDGLRTRAPTIYVYFDNDHNAYAAHNAIALRQLLVV